MAIKLREAGIDSFRVIEKQPELVGISLSPWNIASDQCFKMTVLQRVAFGTAISTRVRGATSGLPSTSTPSTRTPTGRAPWLPPPRSTSTSRLCASRFHMSCEKFETCDRRMRLRGSGSLTGSVSTRGSSRQCGTRRLQNGS